jgi:hypothetical protein
MAIDGGRMLVGEVLGFIENCSTTIIIPRSGTLVKESVETAVRAGT